MASSSLPLSHFLRTDGNDGEQQWTIFINGKLSHYNSTNIITDYNKSTQMLYLKGQNKLITLIRHAWEEKNTAKKRGREIVIEFMCIKSVSNNRAVHVGHNPCMKLYLISAILQKNYISFFHPSLHPFSPSPLIPVPVQKAN